MTISRRTALRGIVLSWPAILIAPPVSARPVLPHPRVYQLSAAGQALCASIVDRCARLRFAWIEPRDRVLAGWSNARLDQLQIATARWELDLLNRVTSFLYRCGM